MSLSFNSSISGIRAATDMLSTSAHNIANINTDGYKKHVLLWVETNYIGIHERAPNTDGTDGCTEHQFPEEIISLTLKAGKENFCNEPDANLQWESLILEYPDDMQIHTLHALMVGLCFKVNRGDLTVGQTTEIFENMKRALIDAEAR